MPGFDPSELADHYAKHGADFPVSDDRQYEAQAAQFLVGPRRASLLECFRSGGDLVRYDAATEEFGVLSGNGVIRTYYKPVPCRVRMVPFCHGEVDNIQYFRRTCRG
jgi:pyocin large subunit-like protein